MNLILSNAPNFKKKSTMKRVTPSLSARATTPWRNKASLAMAVLKSGLQCLKPGVLSAWRLLWAVVLGLVFATTASAQTTENKEVMPKLADWVYRKPPKDVPLRVGVVPAEALVPPVTSNVTKKFLVCNRIWLDQGGSYERPFVVTYASGNRVSNTADFAGIFLLDNYFLHSHNDWARLETNGFYGKGSGAFFNTSEEAVLLIDHDQQTNVGNIYWALYLKRLSSGRCPKTGLSECKRFEAHAELFEFELSGWTNNYSRKVDLGIAHIESLCVGQQYLYHREPFLQPSRSDRLLHWLQRLRKD
jgi:hypothetical protein